MSTKTTNQASANQPAWIQALAQRPSQQAPIQAAELAARRQRAAQLLRDAGHDALLVEGGPLLRYLTGAELGRSERLFAYLLSADGESLWISPFFERDRAQLLVEQTGGELLTWREHEYAWDPITAHLKQKGCEQVAVDPSARLFVFNELGQRLGKERVHCADQFAIDLRAIKSSKEIELLRAANEATQYALSTLSQQLQPGQTELEVHGLICAAQEALGLKNPWALVLFQENSALPHGRSSDRALRSGDVVLIDTGGALHGYQSDNTRSFLFEGSPGCLGSHAGEFERTWKAVQAAQQAAYAALKPGALACDVDRAARACLEEAGYGPGDKLFTHRLGHGIGMEGHEPPYLDGGSQAVLQPGMTFSNEPGVYRLGMFGLRLEDIVLVTEDGADHFGDWPESWDAPF